MDDKTRVNKISVNVDKYETRISLYKTNQLVGFCYGDDIGIEPITNYNISVKAYQLYVKDLVINLLDNGGFEGLYYEPKQAGESVKYDNSSFYKGITKYVEDVIGDRYEFILNQDYNMQVERYKDSYIKNAEGRFKLKIKEHNIEFIVIGNIRSGQLCRPRIMEHNGREYAFNITAINKIVRTED